MAGMSSRLIEGRSGTRAIGVVLLGVAAFLVISLATYSAGDYPNSTRPPAETTNWGGRVGALIAFWALNLVGYAAFGLPLLCLVWGVGQLCAAPLVRNAGRSLGVLAMALLLAMASGLPRWPEETAFRLGGWFGAESARAVLIPYLGHAGGAVVVGTLFTAALVLVTGVSLVPVGRALLWLARLAWRCLCAVVLCPWRCAVGLVRFVDSLFAAGPAGPADGGEVAAAAQPEPQELLEPEPAERDELEPLAAGEADESEQVGEAEAQTEPGVRLGGPSVWGLARPRSGSSEPEAAPEGAGVAPDEHEPEEITSGPRLPRPAGRRDAPDVPQWIRTMPEVGSATGKRSRTSRSRYRPPGIDLLDQVPPGQGQVDEAALRSNARMLEQALANFDVGGTVVQVSPGPVVTRYEVEPAPGVKVNRIVTLADDLARVMSANGIRIQAPVPGKSVVGVEIANQQRETVYLREILESRAFRQAESKLTMALGKIISGEPFVADLTRMPHLLVAGATGSGKSVCINSVICSMLFKASPEEVRFLLVDPKVVELTVYDGIPHLLAPVVTEPKRAAEALRWAVAEMEVRYKKLAKLGVRNLADYNRRLAKMAAAGGQEDAPLPAPLPYVVVVIDEFADLMLTAPADVETALMALAQKSRAVGIHIILATQRPSVNVITGVIKANFPSRIAFQVATKTDSRTILDMNGAERLLGRGDMLFLPGGQGEPIRVHGAYVSGDETEALVAAFKASGYQAEGVAVFPEHADIGPLRGDRDELFDAAVRIVVESQQASTSFLQRRMKVGYARAARLMDELEKAGIVGPADGAKPRQVLIRDDAMETGGTP